MKIDPYSKSIEDIYQKIMEVLYPFPIPPKFAIGSVVRHTRSQLLCIIISSKAACYRYRFGGGYEHGYIWAEKGLPANVGGCFQSPECDLEMVI
jgi:hypothetical protein